MIVSFAVLVGAVGCYTERDSSKEFVPGEPLYEQFTTDGDRFVIERDGEPVMKLRQRTRTTRVYDEAMSPVGRVRVDDGTVERERVDGRDSTPVERTDQAVTLEDTWRLEEIDDGDWVVYTDGDRPVARWRLESDRWTMRTGDDAQFVAEIEGGTSRVVAADQTAVLELDGDELSELAVLALAIEELSPLDRYTLAAWVDENVDRE